MAEQVDAADSKSADRQDRCRFDSGSGTNMFLVQSAGACLHRAGRPSRRCPANSIDDRWLQPGSRAFHYGLPGSLVEWLNRRRGGIECHSLRAIHHQVVASRSWSRYKQREPWLASGALRYPPASCPGRSVRLPRRIGTPGQRCRKPQSHQTTCRRPAGPQERHAQHGNAVPRAGA